MNAEVVYHLTTLSSNCSTCFRRIEASVLVDLLHTHSDEAFNARYVLVDCRYPYEFNGGHIKHAINFYNRESVNTLFFDENKTPKHQKIPIFYCEYSQKRGPKMANALRVFDRSTNESAWPHCSFAEIYVLDKGYRNFFNTTRIHNEILCIPNAFIGMDHEDFAKELKSFQYHKSSKLLKSGKPVYKSHSTPEDLASLRNSDQTPSTPSKSKKVENPPKMLILESPETPPSRGLIRHKTQRNLLSDRFNDNKEPSTRMGFVGGSQEEGDEENRQVTPTGNHQSESSESLKGIKNRGGLTLIENGRPL
ncbi:CBN-CDC-25.2 protein [Caenorhabditis brenneri]|uniref:protein-tyrosine-phosphatase n=1 Tax=Caenorhabditis brenneri TaxID=135651 RepID=G0PD69_CAEBE|nr:CBN-CDC-25.2 protein [Caenorhabditis brenneri]